MKHVTVFSEIVLICILLFSCATIRKVEVPKTVQPEQPVLPVQPPEKKEMLTITFGGDIMAHIPNFMMKDFNKIWTDVTPLLRESDLALANIEAPIDDSRDYHSYPTFNIHHEYADAAVKAGFNVFSLANNHANDQGLAGIRQTEKWLKETVSTSENSSRPVYGAGLKEKNAPFSYQVITIKNWRILFLPVTEILNSPSYSEYINYVPPDKQNRSDFITKIIELRKRHQCDLFIISVHCHDKEYVRTIDESQRQFYYELLRAGADIVWANHPHVAKNWEIIGSNGKQKKLIMYANGNTISGQRWDPQFSKPDTARDYTGDGYLIHVTFSKTVTDAGSGNPAAVEISGIDPVLITTYIDQHWNFIVKRLDDTFLTQILAQGRKNWAQYLNERKKIMEKTRGYTIWQ